MQMIVMLRCVVGCAEASDFYRKGMTANIARLHFNASDLKLGLGLRAMHRICWNLYFRSGSEAAMSLRLTSAAFQHGADIPKRYTCDGSNVSPPLAWTGAPSGTRSFLLVCNDPDAPGGIFHHWAAFDIPPDWHGLKEGEGVHGAANGFRQAINDFGKPGYSGPCPPHGHKPHRYYFHLSALSEESLRIGSQATCAQVIATAAPYILGSVDLIGHYGRGGR